MCSLYFMTNQIIERSHPAKCTWKPTPVGISIVSEISHATFGLLPVHFQSTYSLTDILKVLPVLIFGWHWYPNTCCLFCFVFRQWSVCKCLKCFLVSRQCFRKLCILPTFECKIRLPYLQWTMYTAGTGTLYFSNYSKLYTWILWLMPITLMNPIYYSQWKTINSTSNQSSNSWMCLLLLKLDCIDACNQS